MLVNRFRLLSRIAAPDGGGNGSGDADPPATSDPQGGFQRALARTNGDSSALAFQLYQENYRYRDELRQARARVPAEGAVVLTGTDAQAWQDYRSLGELPAIRQQLTERQTATEELARLRRTEVVRAAAEAAGYTPAVLARLADGLELEVREADGQRTGYVREGQTTTPLAEYASRQWSDFLPALVVQRAPAGTPFVRQGAGGPPPEKSVADEMVTAFKTARARQPNPLAPKEK